MPEAAMLREIEEAIQKTLDWLLSLPDWRTYDPYDIKGSNAVIQLLERRKRYAPLVLRLAHWAGLLAPTAARRFLGIKKVLTPGGVAYLLSGISRLRASGSADERLPLIADSAYQAIIGLQNAKGGWGLPFPWYSAKGVVIPAGSTLAYTVYAVLSALLDHYEVTRDPRVMRLIGSSLESSLSDLNLLQSDSWTAFSYSRYDTYKVINTNSLLAGLLARMAFWEPGLGVMTLADSLAEFVLSAQMEDGSWPYFYPESEPVSAADSYHTAMTLQGLVLYARYSRSTDSRITKAIRRGADFYLDHFVGCDGEPALWIGRRYPVDIASCAEGIELLFTYGSELERAGLRLGKRDALLRWALTNMMTEKGEWVFRRYGPLRFRLGSLRWGQAMMLRSLAGAYRATVAQLAGSEQKLYLCGSPCAFPQS